MKKNNFTRLALMRKIFHYTQKDIAEILNVDVMVVSSIERGVAKMKKEYEKFLEEFLKLPPGTLNNEYLVPVPIIDKVAGSIFTKNNIVSWTGLFAKNVNFEEVIAVHVQDDAMEPIIPKGSLAFVKINERVSLGQVGAFIVNGTAVIREFSTCELKAVNSAYSVDIGKSTIETAGKLISVQFDWDDKLLKTVNS